LPRRAGRGPDGVDAVGVLRRELRRVGAGGGGDLQRRDPGVDRHQCSFLRGVGAVHAAADRPAPAALVIQRAPRSVWVGSRRPELGEFMSARPWWGRVPASKEMPMARTASTMMMELGSQAPAFTLPDYGVGVPAGKQVSLDQVASPGGQA